jgi:hypothetical protein
MRAQCLSLADELGLTGEHAFFGDWVPYEDWPAVLLEADVGLSLHPDTVEARLAYRSRVLDYIWAGLPMVVTKGDAISGIVESYDLGVVVDYEDDAGVAQTLLALLERSRSYWRDQFARAQAEMSWENAARPLLEFCCTPGRAADKDPSNGHSAKLVDQQVNQALAERDAEIVRLRELVARYEQGRFIRLMRQVHRWHQKVGRR